MKKILYVLVIAIVASSCSSPKYTASFNSYDKQNNQIVKLESVVSESVPATQPEQLLASTSSAPVEINAVTNEEVRKTYVQMTKTERKALRSHLRGEIKSYVKEQKKNLSVESTNSTAALDNDLKLASIFGAVGIVAMLIGGDVFYIIGAIALIVGVVFLVKWIVRQ